MRSVYSDRRWRQTRKRAIARAGGCCQAIERDRRCWVRSGLQGHHHYEGGVEAMLADGLDPFDERYVVVLCDRHHRQLEAWLRRNPSFRR